MWAKISMATALFMTSLAVSAETGSGAPPAGFAADQQAYCEYVTQQAQAQRDLLLTPSAVAGVTQPNTGLPAQLVWGLSSSLSDIRKAGLTMDAARTNCDLYAADTAAQQSVQYGLASLEKKALQHRLDLIRKASDTLDTLIADNTKMVAAQDLTRPMLFSLETTRIKLNSDLADTESKMATLYTPDLVDSPLKTLIAQKQAADAAQQEALEKLNRQNNWDVSLSVGAHQQINPLTDNSGPYGTVTVSYNLGSHAINKHLDQAASTYSSWKKVQAGDVVRNSEIVKTQATRAAAAQSSRLKSLQDQRAILESDLQLVADPSTTAAVDFRNQLTSALLLLNIEIGDAGFRSDQLQAFLNDNF